MTAEEIRIANKTYRSGGASVWNDDGTIRSIVARYVYLEVAKESKILDYGCGKYFVQGNYLKEQGFNVDGWDIGNNKPENCVETLEKKYDVVYASNVLNTMSSVDMLDESLKQIKGCLADDGTFIANYPQTPRKINCFSTKDMINMIEKYFIISRFTYNGVIVCKKKELKKN